MRVRMRVGVWATVQVRFGLKVILPEPSRSMCLKMRYQDCLVGTGSILVAVRVRVRTDRDRVMRVRVRIRRVRDRVRVRVSGHGRYPGDLHVEPLRERRHLVRDRGQAMVWLGLGLGLVLGLGLGLGLVLGLRLGLGFRV